MSTLGILGGSPAFRDPLHVNRPNVGDRATFDGLVDQVWSSRWFTNGGQMVTRLETELGAYLGVRNCVVMSSGTAAMAVLIKTLGLGQEVILPSFTFISTAHTLRWAGITPVFCDVKPPNWNLDPDACEELITDRASAIIATHLWGRPCEVEKLRAIADRHGLELIFDAAHAFGCTKGSRRVGGFGTAEVFSFQANKAFHCGEGGAVTTNDDALADALRRTRSFGFSGFDHVDAEGTNAKMPELSAALGLVNLAAFEESVSKARDVYKAYRDGLDEIDGLSLQVYDGRDASNFQYVTCFLDQGAGLSRDQLVKILHAENVLARRYFYPGCHNMEPYRTLDPAANGRLPVASRVAERIIVLPAGADISIEDVGRVCELIRVILDNAEFIREKLRARGHGNSEAGRLGR